MFPPIFSLAAGSSAVTTLIGTAPVRFWAFGEAEQKPARPYAVWQTAYGGPDNKLAGTPDSDRWGVLVDAYADLLADARAVAAALRDAFEPHGYVVNWNGETREPDTRLFRYSFTVEFMTER